MSFNVKFALRTLVFIAFFGGLLWLALGTEANDAQECESRGGVYIGSYTDTCFAKDAVIDL